jgi:hypothetical protein
LDINEADKARRIDIGNTRFGGDSRVIVLIFSFLQNRKNTK